MNSRNHRAKTFGYRRSGAVVVWVAVSIPFIIGFTAIGIDLSHLHSAKNDLGRATDAAALAAARALAQAETGSDLHQVILDASQDLADRNTVSGDIIEVDPDDISLGHVVLNESGQYDWSPPDSNNTNAVEITLRYSVPMYFGRVIGSDHKDISAMAQAMLVPRDIALVCDASGSMNDDSELRQYQTTLINLQAIWQALASPTYGKMTTWGTDPPLNSGYSVVDDPGLLHLKRNTDWGETARNLLESQGYNAAEVNAASSASENDASTTRWVNRVAVTLGLAAWHSGLTDESTTPPTPPRFPEGGDGDSKVEGNVEGELVWADYPFQQGAWSEYIKDYVRSVTNKMYAANSDFRYRFGLKTFMNYLLERRSGFAETEVLYQTPEQPLQAVKDAVDELVTIITELDSGDQLSLEIYATTAHHEHDLTHTFTEVSGALALIQSNHYDSTTCIGCGLAQAQQELLSANARPGEAVKVIVLLTDGIANATDTTPPGTTDEPGGRAYAEEQAQAAAVEHITIYTVGVGAGADMLLMEQIAEIGGGLSFHAAGTTEEYSDQLREIFRMLGSKRHAVLIR